MLEHLQQMETRTQMAGCKTEVAVHTVPLSPNNSLLPGLALIPTLSGVA